MDLSNHTMQGLFEQLGLPSSEDDIQRFVEQHSPLPEAVRLADAPFWSASQAQFLKREFIEDADWIEIVDQLNLMLRE